MEDFAAFEELPQDVSAPAQPSQPKAQYYIDEEEALGFHIWVAELELLLGQVKGSTANIEPVAALELLQKLLVTIDSSQRERVREYQRRCEEALMEVLFKGSAPPVRRLICACLVQIYIVGDTLPLYSRIASLQTYLGSKAVSNHGAPEAARLGALQALAALSDAHGRSLASSAMESVALAVKFTARSMNVQTKTEALCLMACIVQGLGDRDRNVLSIQADALKAAVRTAKEASSPETCIAAAGVLRAVAQAGGAMLWASGARSYEEAVQLCVLRLEDPSRASGDAFGRALGDLVAASKSPAALQAIHSPKLKPAKKAALEKLLRDAMHACLVKPFVEAAQADKRRSLRAMSQAWISYLANVQSDGEEGELVDLAIKTVEMLAAVKPVTDKSGADADVGAGLSGGELPMAQATVLCILRVGIIERLGETGQRRLLERLVALAASVVGSQVPLAAVTLETLGLLLEVLGEVPSETAQLLQGPLMQKLACHSSLLRMGAATTLSALAIAEPASASMLLSQQLGGLRAAAEKLAALSSPQASAAAPADRQSPPTSNGTPRGLSGPELERVKPAMNAAHGHALGAAALLVAAARLPLGMPSKLRKQAMQLAEKLIRSPGSQGPSGQGVEREAGYILLGALCASVLPKTQKRARLLDFWTVALSPDSTAQLDIRRFVAEPSPVWDVEMAAEMWWHAAALEALQAFILGPLSHAGTTEMRRLQETVAELLAPILDIITAMPTVQDPGKGKGSPGIAFAAAAAALQLRLLEAYLALPDASAFTMEHAAVSKLCARALRSAPGQASSGIAESVASSALRQALNKQDDVLGPWVPGRDPLEDALAAYAGGPGGPLHHPWEAGSPFSAGLSDSEGIGVQTRHRSFQPLPQPRSLAAALLEMQLTLLGSLLAVVSQANQLQILEVLNAAANEGAAPRSRRERADPSRRHTLVTCACAAALAGLHALAQKYRGEVGSRDEVAHKAGVLADSVLNVAADTNDAALQRSAAEIFAFAACIGSTPFAAALVRTLVQALADSPSGPRRAALAVAVGSIVRSKGGIALQSTLGLTAGTLLAAAQVCPGPAQLWLLHGMWLIVNSAGPAFLPHVSATLMHAVEALMVEDNVAVLGLQPAVGRLANALVAVLGPELTLGSPAYCSCRALIREMQAVSMSSGRPEDAAAAALETVSYAQMLVLFAPQAVPATAHLPLLLDTLPSRQPNLRRAAALTLRHLAEKDTAALLPERIEGRLFDALDAETDTEIASQLRATLATLLATGAPSQPSYWLQVCGQVTMAAVDRSATGLGPAGASGSGSGLRGGLDEGLMEGAADDDEDAGVMPSSSSGAPQLQAQLPDQKSGGSQGMRLGTAPRLRTRLFAARCILDIPLSVGADPRHFDPLLAGKGLAGTEWLVQSLQSLIDAGFKMATGQVEALRPLGLQLLQTVLAKFGDARDPLLPEQLLLEQFQAQFVSALRSALTAADSPVLLGAGASLAAAFLERRMAGGDAVVLQRLMTLLTAPLSRLDSPGQEIYAEWVGAEAKLALLEAHAQCRACVAGLPDEATHSSVMSAQEPHARQLAEGWAGVLTDWAALGSLPPDQAAKYQPAVVPERAPIQERLQQAVPAIVVALSSMLSPMHDAAEPLAATAAAAGHRLLSMATQNLQRDMALQSHKGGTAVRCEGSIGRMHSALRALRDLVGTEKPILSTEGAGNIIAVVQQLLDRVLAPAITSAAEPEQAAALKGLLTSCAEILAAVASQPHWQELRQDVALAVLSALGTFAAAGGAGHPSAGPGGVPLAAAFAAAGRLVSADVSHAAPCAAAALGVLQHGTTEANVKEAQAFLACTLPLLAQHDLAMAAACLRTAADIALHSVDKAGRADTANGSLAAAHAKAAAVMTLIADHGALLHADTSAASSRGLCQSEGDAEGNDHFEQAESIPAHETDDAAAAGAAAVQEAGVGRSQQPAWEQAAQQGEQPSGEVQHGSDRAKMDEVEAGGQGAAVNEQGGPSSTAEAAPDAHQSRNGLEHPQHPAASATPQESSSHPAVPQQQQHGRQDSSRAAAEVAEAREHCLRALQACITCESQAAVQSAALRGAAGALKAAASGTAGDAAMQWAHACFNAAVPAAVVSAREAAQAPAVSSAGPLVVQVATDTMALLIAALSVFSGRQTPIMAILLMLLIEAAAPEGQPNAALSGSALKLVNSLASSKHAPVFQAAVAQLPQAAKQRLQVALKAAAQGAPRESAAAQKQPFSLGAPVIKLQNFAVRR